MFLSNFEEWIEDKILKRGLDYYKKGKVINLKITDEGHYKAQVDGSELYNVQASVSGDEILNIYCDCPYNGDYCKHKAAVLFALKNGEIKSPVANKTTPIETSKDGLHSILLNLQKEELISLILTISEEFPEIEKRIIFRYETSKDEIAASKKLIRESINGAKRRGFIDWRHVCEALQGAELTLQKATEKVEKGDTEGAIVLSLAVLSPVVKMLNYSDDSNGEVGTVINWAVRIIDEAVTNGKSSLSDKEQKKLFEVILKEAAKEYFNGWTDWRYDLLGICTHFSHHTELRRKLEKLLSDLIQKADTSWSRNFEKNQIKLLQLRIIENCDGEAAAEKFIYNNIKQSEFREKAIANEFKKENFDKVIQLCEEGETADQEYRGLVFQWKDYRYRAYESKGDILLQRQLAKELLLQANFNYYMKLKELYTPAEWEPVLQELLEEFEKEPFQSSTYLSIIKVEKLTDKILQYCKRIPSLITDLYPYVIKEYPEEVNQVFIEHIHGMAAASSDRRGYRQVCSVIKTYKKACGTLHSHQLIKELRQKHNKRPAFLDELGKVK